MLEGKNVNLRVAEKEDLPLLAEWLNNPEIFGLYNPLMQHSKTELEGWCHTLSVEGRLFLIEKKTEAELVKYIT